MKLKAVSLSAIALAAAVLVAACGGGGGSSPSAEDATPVAGVEVGVLTDAQIQGVRYVTSSGVSGTTDADGRYNYNPGDTVTFTIGEVTLGEVPATGIVTPIQLANGSDAKLKNLLVVLQSLDADGDPANGISIPAAAATALTTAIDLSGSLSSSATDAIKAAMTAAGIQGEMKTVEDAEHHFLSQAAALLASNVWISVEGGKPVAAVYVASNGYYLIGEANAADDAGHSGFEWGTLGVSSVNSKGFAVDATALKDTTGEWGLSHPQPDERFSTDGENLIVTDSLETVKLVRMENDPAGIVGAWAVADEEGHPSTDGLVLFFKDGYFMYADSVGESKTMPPGDQCSTGGVEFGKYDYDTASKVVTPSAQEYNTNGCVGFFEADGSSNATTHTFTLSADGKTAVWKSTEGSDSWEVNLVRVSR
ncbi:hypothetical protein [Ramlibacter sp.]|uniref:hypothetical protein n=1 Tax=Ramlibacter sp. TaxID=1917967 RepID=UPI002D69E966|nr:hypothetical protein [Ramlibacter sp.]HYD76313.1 hypothetical protein [Ramlibacter sp.]